MYVDPCYVRIIGWRELADTNHFFSNPFNIKTTANTISDISGEEDGLSGLETNVIVSTLLVYRLVDRRL